MQKILIWLKKNRVKIILGLIVSAIMLITILIIIGRVGSAIIALIMSLFIIGVITKTLQEKKEYKKKDSKKLF